MRCGMTVGRSAKLAAWAFSVVVVGFAATSVAGATEPSEEASAESTADDGAPVGAIVAGCLGVLFGGLIARWQIKALAKRN